MSEQVPTNPTPTAVPWTPDMMTPDMSSPNPVLSAGHAQPQMQPGQYQPAPQFQAPGAEYAPAAAPHTYASQPQMQPTMQPPSQPGQYAPAPQPQHVSAPQYAPALQPVHHMQQPAPPQMASAAAVPYQTERQPQYAQPGLPPQIQPQLPPASSDLPGMTPLAPAKPKSVIANLLGRSPKPAMVATNIEAPASSGSLFNKNFLLGAVSGLVVGAFVLPMVLGIFFGDSGAAQTQALAETSADYDPAPAATDGDTFVDSAIATDAP